jgi:hypothetical protein
MDNRQPDTGQFIRDWLIFSVLVWPLALGAWVMACIPVGFVFSFLGSVSGPVEHVVWIATLIVAGALIGYMIGDAQRSTMRDSLAWWSPKWATASIWGSLLGGFMVIVGQTVLTLAGVSSLTLQLMLMPLFAIGLSAGQWVVLRDMAHQAWVWVVGNTSAAVVFSGLLLLNPSPLPGHIGMFTWFMVAALAQGAVTGYVILWLYENLRRTPDDDREPAPVYLEVRNRSHDKRR